MGSRTRGSGTLGLLGALAAAAPAPATSADPFFAHEEPRYRNGAELLEDCSSSDPVAQASCAGYVMAVADVLGGATATVDGIEACLHGTEPLADLIEVVRRHLEANPARANIKGDGAVAYALSIYRPCVDSEATFDERLPGR